MLLSLSHTVHTSAQQQVNDGSSTTIIEKLIDAGQLSEARRELKELISTRSETQITRYLEAKILFKERRFAESLGKLPQAADLTGNSKQADLSLDGALAEDRFAAEVYKLTGLNYVLLNRLSEAEPFLKAAVNSAPKDYLARYHLGLLYYTTSRFASAEGELNETVKLRPAFAKGHDTLGLILEETGNEAAVIKCYRRAIELAEQQKLRAATAYFHLGRFLLTRNRFAESVPLLERAAQLDTQSAEARFLLGKALNKLGKQPEAVAILTKAISLDPALAEPHYLLSRIYLSLGREAEARKELQIFQEIQQIKTKAKTNGTQF